VLYNYPQYLLHKRHRKTEQQRLCSAFLKIIEDNLRENLDKLKRGDLGWRRLGHGKATIGLKKTAPKKADVIPISLDTFKTEYPEITRIIKDIDSKINRLQPTCKRLAANLEEPVREKFMKDREHLAGEDSNSVMYFRKWLYDQEDGWITIVTTVESDETTITFQDDEQVA